MIALDMTTGMASLAVQQGPEGHRKAFFFEEAMGMDMSARGVLWIRNCLEQAGLKPAQVGRVVVPRGPGSFTGIRLGLAVAHGFALAAGAALTGIDLLDFLEHKGRAAGAEGPFLVLVPLLKDRAVVRVCGEEGATPWTMGSEDAEAWRHLPWVWDRSRSALLPAQGTIVSWTAQDLLVFARQNAFAGSGTDPLYVRPPGVTRSMIPPAG